MPQRTRKTETRRTPHVLNAGGRRPSGPTRRRATIMIMVVSLLALLFVIVTGFLGLARSNRLIFNELRRNTVSEQMLASTREMALSFALDQLRDANGYVLGGPTAQFSDIAGYGGSNWLASLEPVWDEGAFPPPEVDPFGDLGRVAWPTLTTLDSGTTPSAALRGVSLLGLIPELLGDGGSSEAIVAANDVRQYSRQPWLDADADGIPDSSLIAMSALIEQANAFAGSPVSVPGVGSTFSISTFPQSPAAGVPQQNRETFERLLDQASYWVALRIVPHGGMTALDSAPLEGGGGSYSPINRLFTLKMFDRLRNPNDTSQYALSRYLPSQPDVLDELFDEIAASRWAMELHLRRRGGLLPSPQAQNIDNAYLPGTGVVPSRVPPVLAVLQGEVGGANDPRFPATFLPLFATPTSNGSSVKNNTAQLVNLADSNSGNEGTAAMHALALRPRDYNFADLSKSAANKLYSRRGSITTTSNSDDLALKQTSAEPTTTNASKGTYRGEMKFYLGELSKAFKIVQAGAGQYQYLYNKANGDVLIRRMHRLYRDMLRSHDGNTSKWGDVTGAPPANPDGSSAVKVDQQAWMLAVNTMQFATPRYTDPTHRGWVELVTYDTGEGTYVGAAPQPFLTEVIAYRAPDDPNDPSNAQLALAVELFNPQDPLYDVDGDGAPDFDFNGDARPDDAFALNFDQFALTIEDAGSALMTLPVVTLSQQFATLPAPPMNGRQFYAFPFEDGDNDFFDRPDVQTLNISIPDSATEIVVRLWQRTRPNAALGTGWFEVDELRLNNPSHGSWAAVHRDTSPTTYFAEADYDGDGQIEPARWSIATGRDERIPPGSGGIEPLGQPNKNAMGDQRWVGGSGLVDPDVTSETFAPVTPLITMNAGVSPAGDLDGDGFLEGNLADLALFLPGATSNDLNQAGWDLRPRSFPTPGFLLFVPRFSHFVSVSGARRPVAMTLNSQWVRQFGDTVDAHPDNGNYPADFGHMPVLDNSHPVDDQSKTDHYLASLESDPAAPQGVPWGLLVFDYFTTLNPNQPGVDPLKVPGRINLNAAPWLTLANLPLIGPSVLGMGSEFPAISPTWPLTELDDPGQQLPLRTYYPSGQDLDQDIAASPSPAFWDPRVGVLIGRGSGKRFPGTGAPGDGMPNGGVDEDDGRQERPLYRFIGSDPDYRATGNMANYLYGNSMPFMRRNASNPTADDDPPGLWRLGPWLGVSAAAYRDGVQMVPIVTANPAGLERMQRYADANLRDGYGTVFDAGGNPLNIANTGRRQYRRALYDDLRGGWTGASDDGSVRPRDFGFVAVGELLNAKGFDSSRDTQFAVPPVNAADTVANEGDYVKAVSLLALLDTQVLTTRSNTFTAYASVMDRNDPEASVRTQVTFDRSNLLPRLTYVYLDPSGSWPPPANAALIYPGEVARLSIDTDGDGFGDVPVRSEAGNASPSVIAEQTAGYFNTQFDN